MAPQDDDQPKAGSGRDVDDYCSFCEGDIEPSLNKKIHAMISCEKNYMVYIDDEFTVQWTWNDAYGDDPPGFADVASRVGHLETLGETQLSKKQVALLARLLGEGMARVVAEKNEQKALDTLKDAEAYLRSRGAENARCWYIAGSFVIAFLSMVIVFTLWILRNYLIPHIGSGAFEVLLGACLGGPGALLSILFRFEKIPIEPAAGRWIHHIEGAARTVAGNAGALLVALAVEANIVFGVAKSSAYFLPTLLVLSFVAGASERLVRGFIYRMERPGQQEDKDERSTYPHYKGLLL
jgi:hypothetical protein